MKTSRVVFLLLLLSGLLHPLPGRAQSQRVLFPAGTGSSADSSITVFSTIGEPLIGAQGGTQFQGIGFWGVVAGANLVLPPMMTVVVESLDFGLGALGDESVLTVAVSNAGGQDLVISGWVADLEDVSTDADTLRVSGGSTGVIEIHLDRTALGRLSGVLRLQSNDPVRPTYEIALAGSTGWARGPTLFVEGGPVEFPTTRSGDTTIVEVPVTNVGDALLIVDAEVMGDGFRSATSSLTLTTGASGVVVVIHTPVESVADADGVLTLKSNDPSQPRKELALRSAVQMDVGPVVLDFIIGPGDQGLRVLGGARPGSIYSIELVLRDTLHMRGWSAELVFDRTVLDFVDGSFTPSTFLTGFLPLSILGEGSAIVGGSTLTSYIGATGPATLGIVRFVVQEAFGGQAEITVTEITLDRVGGADEIIPVSSTAILRSDEIELNLPGDFDGSKDVGLNDFLLFASAFGSADRHFDLNGDGRVSFPDFFLFTDFFGLAVRISP